ncbi:hypothetical protein IQ268_13615 [Oculatella sp. LEGE 06141]|uniref:hypothetical protein n=1 Tax=Oculatella sp. LEGE 06141 TaxID=1828648 RepID=UPI0018830A4B|nr:hypothetical protein [Oculatella sp. LEGE 06141]MBE9179601.1 hypothetical protein [Oculatella sp. LEGE 06141]
MKSKSLGILLLMGLVAPLGACDFGEAGGEGGEQLEEPVTAPEGGAPVEETEGEEGEEGGEGGEGGEG